MMDFRNAFGDNLVKEAKSIHAKNLARAKQREHALHGKTARHPALN